LTQKEGWYIIWSLWPTRFRIRGQFWCFLIFACRVLWWPISVVDIKRLQCAFVFLKSWQHDNCFDRSSKIGTLLNWNQSWSQTFAVGLCI